MPIESLFMTCYLTAILIFDLSVMVLRDNRVRTFEILLIWNFDLKIECHGHEQQRSVLHHYMTNCVTYNLLKNCRSTLNPLCMVHHQIGHAYVYLLYHVKDREFSFDLENLYQDHRFGMPNLQKQAIVIKPKKWAMTHLIWTSNMSCSPEKDI